MSDETSASSDFERLIAQQELRKKLSQVELRNDEILNKIPQLGYEIALLASNESPEKVPTEVVFEYLGTRTDLWDVINEEHAIQATLEGEANKRSLRYQERALAYRSGNLTQDAADFFEREIREIKNGIIHGREFQNTFDLEQTQEAFLGLKLQFDKVGHGARSVMSQIAQEATWAPFTLQALEAVAIRENIGAHLSDAEEIKNNVQQDLESIKNFTPEQSVQQLTTAYHHLKPHLTNTFPRLVELPNFSAIERAGEVLSSTYQMQFHPLRVFQFDDNSAEWILTEGRLHPEGKLIADSVSLFILPKTN